MRVVVVEKNKKIDYDKIEEITRKVVREELENQRKAENAVSPNDELQNIIANAIIKANDMQEKINKEKEKNKKVSKLIIFIITEFIIFSIVFFAGAFLCFFDEALDFKVRMIAGATLLILVAFFCSLIPCIIKIDKTSDENLKTAMTSMIITFAAFIMSLVLEVLS